MDHMDYFSLLRYLDLVLLMWDKPLRAGLPVSSYKTLYIFTLRISHNTVCYAVPTAIYRCLFYSNMGPILGIYNRRGSIPRILRTPVIDGSIIEDLLKGLDPG